MTARMGSDADVQKALNDPQRNVSLLSFEMTGPTGVSALYKADNDDWVIWGPASVEVVDRENDRIKAKALEEALPQLLKRSTLSYEHTDQIVGEILSKYTTDEEVTLDIQGNTYTRKEFPTGVLDLPGMEPAMYVAGKVYGDTRKSREVREAIANNEMKSYSISGEAIVSEMAVEDGVPVTDILKMDLSAVTLCRQGMNQKAKFDLVSKTLSDGSDASDLVGIAKSAVSDKLRPMSNTDDDIDTEALEKSFQKVLDDALPDGDLATVEDVEKHVSDRFEEFQKGMSDYEEPEEVDEEEVPDDPEGAEAVDVKEKSATELLAEMKSELPTDQWETIKPIVKDCMGDGMDDLEVVDGDADPGEDEEDPLEDFDMKSVGELEGEEAETVAKALLEKAGGQAPSPGVSKGETEPAHQQESRADVTAESIAKEADQDPVLAGMMDEDGNYRI